MSIRRLIVETDLDGLNVTEFCAQHGVSTWFFYQLRKRYAAEGEAGLEPRSRAAKTVVNKTPDWVQDLVVEKRKELDSAGWDAGPASIWSHLGDRRPPGRIPSEATIWRVLTRRGFITSEPKKAPKHAHCTFAAERANECWQVDDIDWELIDSTKVKAGAISFMWQISPRPSRGPLVSGTWNVTDFVSYNAGTPPFGDYGRVRASILEVTVVLRSDAGGSIPGTLKIACNIGFAGISTGKPEGFELSVPGFNFDTPVVGLTHISIPEGESSV